MPSTIRRDSDVANCRSPPPLGQEYGQRQESEGDQVDDPVEDLEGIDSGLRLLEFRRLENLDLTGVGRELGDQVAAHADVGGHLSPAFP